MKLSTFCILGLGTAGLVASGAHAQNAKAGLDAMRELNVFTKGSAAINSHVEGKVHVGGALSGTTVVGSGGSQSQKSSDRATLTVGGSQSGTVTVENGNAGSAKVATKPGVKIGGSAGNVLLNTQKAPGTSNGTVFIGGSVNQLSTTDQNMTINVGGKLNGNFNLQSGTTLNVKGDRVGDLNLNGPATVKVGGKVQGSVSTNNAGSSLTVGGTVSGAKNKNSGTLLTNQGAGVAGGMMDFAAESAAIMSQTSQIGSDIDALSANIRNLTNYAPTISSFGTALTASHLTSNFGYSQGFAAFTVTNGSSFFSGGGTDIGELFRNVPTVNGVPLTIVINVLGSGAISQGQGVNFNWLGSNLNQYLLWNFVDATSITLRDFNGSILAPKAAVTFTSGHYEGSLAAATMSTNYQVHLGTFNGTDSFIDYIPPPPPMTAVPEPATWLQMLLGFGAAGTALRYRRRRAFAAA